MNSFSSTDDKVRGVDSDRYARSIEASKRVSWDLDKDVIRGRTFDYSQKFMPDGLSLVHEIDGLNADEQRFLSQVQGRTYANIFGLAERFINAKILDLTKDHWFGDQVALEALVRFSDEELKHQEMFRRIEYMLSADMPSGYRVVAEANYLAKDVLGRSTWAVLALSYHIELFTMAHYRESIEPSENLSPLFKDIFLFHWQEESQHVVIDEMEWRRKNQDLNDEEREQGVTDLIELVGVLDVVLQAQAESDLDYFVRNCDRALDNAQCMEIAQALLKAYRWQYIFSGVQAPRFQSMLSEMATAVQLRRIASSLSALKN